MFILASPLILGRQAKDIMESDDLASILFSPEGTSKRGVAHVVLANRYVSQECHIYFHIWVRDFTSTGIGQAT